MNPQLKARAIIAEDEPLLAQSLIAHLHKLWPALEICEHAPNGEQAIHAAFEQRPDILFLDIKMPGKSGLEVVEELSEQWPDGVAFPYVVFVTAYDEHALKAFEFAAVDYLLKPVNQDRLARALQRLQDKLDHQTPENNLDRMMEQLRVLARPDVTSERLHTIRAAVGNQIRLIPVESVQYFEASDKYISVVTQEHSSLIRMSLRELLPQLDPQQFWQIHRSTVVNTRCMQAAYRDESGKISLKLHGREEKLQVSRIYAHLFKQM